MIDNPALTNYDRVTVPNIDVQTNRTIATDNLSLAPQIQPVVTEQIHLLGAGSLDSTGAIKSAGIVQDHNVSAANLYAHNEILAEWLYQVQQPLADHLYGHNEIQEGNTGFRTNLESDTHLSIGTEIQSAGIDVDTNTVADNLYLQAENQSGALGQTCFLDTPGLLGGEQIQSGGISKTLILTAWSLSSTHNVQSGRVHAVQNLIPDHLETTGTVQSAAIGYANNFTPAHLYSHGTIQQEEVFLPFGISDAATVETKILPLFWEEPCVVIGKFGIYRGRVWAEQEQCTIDTWTDGAIWFTPHRGANPGDAVLDLHVERVAGPGESIVPADMETVNEVQSAQIILPQVLEAGGAGSGGE